MLKLHDGPVVWRGGRPVAAPDADMAGRENTIAYSILRAHDAGGAQDKLRIKFDSLISHDITYVGVIQTARASGMTRFPVPYVLTNCHNSLCAVGGTINEDDHVFGSPPRRNTAASMFPPTRPSSTSTPGRCSPAAAGWCWARTATPAMAPSAPWAWARAVPRS